jgi:hypothetical protein
MLQTAFCVTAMNREVRTLWQSQQQAPRGVFDEEYTINKITYMLCNIFMYVNLAGRMSVLNQREGKQLKLAEINF